MAIFLGFISGLFIYGILSKFLEMIFLGYFGHSVQPLADILGLLIGVGGGYLIYKNYIRIHNFNGKNVDESSYIKLSKSKWNFILCGAVIMVFPFIEFIIPFLGMGIYAAPVVFLAAKVGLGLSTFSNMDLSTANFINILTIPGWIVTVIFWFIIGIAYGIFIYDRRKTRALEKGLDLSPQPDILFIFSTLAVQVAVGLLLPYLAGGL